MTVCFNENIYIKIFDEYNIYTPKIRKCKEFDGPNNYSILWNQLLILTYNNIIYDNYTLTKKFNINILKLYKNRIIVSITKLLHKFIILKNNHITLYYDNYKLENNKDFNKRLNVLYNYIYNL